MTQWFSDSEDARTYLTEVARLWLAWIATLVLLIVFDEWWALLVTGVAFLTAMAILGRPLQDRAQRVADPETAVGSTLRTAMGGGRRKDIAFRQLMYGEAPLRQALALAGITRHFIWLRRFVVAATLAALIWVMIGLFSAQP
jgi:hypothetical protein